MREKLIHFLETLERITSQSLSLMEHRTPTKHLFPIRCTEPRHQENTTIFMGKF